MDAPLSSPPTVEATDVAMALSALERERSPAGEPIDRSATEPQGHTDGAATGRAVLLTMLIGLLIGGVIAVLKIDDHHASRPAKDTASRAEIVFDSARSGNCLTWPNNSPGQASFVACKDDHLFEVAESIDMRSFQAPCELAVRRYLGPHYDPNSRFTVTALWSGDAAGTQPGARRLLCGLQLLGPDGQPIAFKGLVAEIDQSQRPPDVSDPKPDAPEQRPSTPPAAAVGTPSPVPSQPPPGAVEAIAAPSPTPTPVASSTPTPVASPTPTPVASPTPTPVASPTPTPVASPTPTPVAWPTTSASPSPAALAGPLPEAAPTPVAPPPSTEAAPAPPVLEIPGLPPITLPVLPPPAPPPGA